jgi:hypothetical protein
MTMVHPRAAEWGRGVRLGLSTVFGGFLAEGLCFPPGASQRGERDLE